MSSSLQFYEPKGGYSDVCPLPPSGVFALFFVVRSGVSFAYSVFVLLSSVPPVSCACFPAPVVLFVVITYLSGQCICLSIAPTFLHRPSLSYFRYWLRLFSFFPYYSLSTFLPMVPHPFISVFLAYLWFVFSAWVSLHADLLFLLPLSACSLLLQGFAASLAVPLFRSSFSFSFLFIGLTCGVLSFAFFLLAPCFAWLRASLSLRFLA